MEIAEVRNSDALEAVLAGRVERFGGRLDVVVANAGISKWGALLRDVGRAVADYRRHQPDRCLPTMKAAVLHMLSAGNGGSIITISWACVLVHCNCLRE
jgi:NAD(P)-dependent dehydrogenase (short-subunit alcohol dehydrogenase family)